MILPVRHAASGGFLLKLRNAQGDRVVSAPHFFRDNGIEDDRERRLECEWNHAAAALVADNVFVETGKP